MKTKCLKNAWKILLLTLCMNILFTVNPLAATSYYKLSYGDEFNWGNIKSKTLKVDMNKDGRKEKVLCKRVNTSFGASWIIYINGKKQLASIQQFIIVDLNNADRYIEIIARQYEKKGSEYVLYDCFYRYTGKKLKRISKNKVTYASGEYSPRNLWGSKKCFPGNGTIVDEILVFTISDNGDGYGKRLDPKGVIEVSFKIQKQKLKGDFYGTFTTVRDARKTTKQKWSGATRVIYTGTSGNQVAFRMKKGTSFVITKMKIGKSITWFRIQTGAGKTGWFPMKTSSLKFGNRNGFDNIY